MSTTAVSPLPSLNGWNTTPTIPGPRPLPYFSHIGKGGKDALWIGFVVFFVSTMAVAVMASRLEKKHRVFHLLTMLIMSITALSYYAMAVGVGNTYVNIGGRVVQGHRTIVMRQVFWAREVDWAFTTPLLLLELALLAGMPLLGVISLLVVDEAMVATSLFSALHPGQAAAKWGWYAFGCVFLLNILYMLLWSGRKYAQDRHESIFQLYTQLSIYTAVLWLMYPIFFALGEGAGRISSDAEAIVYTVLDIFTKIGFGLWLLTRHKHDSEGESAVMLLESWTEPWGTKGNAIQLPEDGDD